MNKTPTVVVMATLTFVPGLGTAVAQDEEQGRQFFPVETFTCDYLDGKGPGDFDRAIDKWNKWMDKNETSDYFAVTVVPYYFGENSFDVGWLGSWPSGEAMGRGTDQWVTKGGDIAAESLDLGGLKGDEIGARLSAARCRAISQALKGAAGGAG